MTIFLLEYEPASGERIELRPYPEEERDQAEADRLEREQANAAAHRRREVVLLEAVDEATLRSTHSRYFKTLPELAGAGE